MLFVSNRSLLSLLSWTNLVSRACKISAISANFCNQARLNSANKKVCLKSLKMQSSGLENCNDNWKHLAFCCVFKKKPLMKLPSLRCTWVMIAVPGPILSCDGYRIKKKTVQLQHNRNGKLLHKGLRGQP